MHPGSLRRLVAALAVSVGVCGLTVPVAGAAPAEKQVAYAGVTVSVPADWPVIDLDASDDVCVRLDVDAVYLGTAPEQQNCPLPGGRAWQHGLDRTDRRRRADRHRPQGWSSPGAGHDPPQRPGQAIRCGAPGSRRLRADRLGSAGSAAVDAIVADMEISADPVPVPSRAPAQRRTTVPTLARSQCPWGRRPPRNAWLRPRCPP